MSININEEIFKGFTFRDKPIKWIGYKEGIIKLSNNNRAKIDQILGLYDRLMGYKIKITSIRHGVLDKIEFLFSDLTDISEVWVRQDQLKWYSRQSKGSADYTLDDKTITDIINKFQKKVLDYIYCWVEDWE
jgi:hypothetical protein